MTINSLASNQLQTSMIRIATGQRINSARDDAAGLGISERMTAQIRGFDQGTQNLMDMQSLINTAEGALSNIGDNLLRMRELTLQAMNGILTDSDRQNIQFEIDQIMHEIDNTAQRTEFNTLRLLDGSFNREDGRGLHTAGDSMGRGPMIHIGNMSSGIILGPEEFNVVDMFRQEPQDPPYPPVQGPLPPTPPPSGELLERIDQAHTRVTRERSYLGAMSNRFDHTIASNQITNLNLAAANSRIRDADLALELMRMSQAQVLEQAQLAAQRRQQEHTQREGTMLFSRL